MNSEEIKLGYSYLQAINPIWERISIYDGAKVFLKQFGKVTPQWGHLFAAHWCQAEVCNGGFHQFFHNTTGVLAPEAADGFEAIGLNDLAALVREAMELFGQPYPREREKRINILDRIPGETRKEWDPFYELNTRFYALLGPDHLRFAKAADEYARKATTKY